MLCRRPGRVRPASRARVTRGHGGGRHAHLYRARAGVVARWSLQSGTRQRRTGVPAHAGVPGVHRHRLPAVRRENDRGPPRAGRAQRADGAARLPPRRENVVAGDRSARRAAHGARPTADLFRGHPDHREHRRPALDRGGRSRLSCLLARKAPASIARVSRTRTRGRNHGAPGHVLLAAACRRAARLLVSSPPGRAHLRPEDARVVPHTAARDRGWLATPQPSTCRLLAIERHRSEEHLPVPSGRGRRRRRPHPLRAHETRPPGPARHPPARESRRVLRPHVPSGRRHPDGAPAHDREDHARRPGQRDVERPVQVLQPSWRRAGLGPGRVRRARRSWSASTPPRATA